MSLARNLHSTDLCANQVLKHTQVYWHTRTHTRAHVYDREYPGDINDETHTSPHLNWGPEGERWKA
jgi:hypothetical protein